MYFLFYYYNNYYYSSTSIIIFTSDRSIYIHHLVRLLAYVSLGSIKNTLIILE
jgi:hypothetical protein